MGPFKNRKTGTQDLRKTGKRGPQWDPQKTQKVGHGTVAVLE